MPSFRRAIVVTLASAVLFAQACDTAPPTSRALSLEAAPLEAGRGGWDLHIAIDAGDGRQASELALGFALDLEGARPTDIAGAALHFLDDRGRTIGAIDVPVICRMRREARIEARIEDPCLDRARCTLALKLELRMRDGAGEVVAHPLVEASIPEGTLVLAGE